MTAPTITVKWNTGAKDGSPTWTDAYPIPEKSVQITGVIYNPKEKKTSSKC